MFFKLREATVSFSKVTRGWVGVGGNGGITVSLPAPIEECRMLSLLLCSSTSASIHWPRIKKELFSFHLLRSITVRVTIV